ncbi:MAG TPA: hypothetical protein PKA64_23195, partial [Myxococcota bacterium]|nr:hypothetical protein [Myxococcota bacterium]
STVSAALDAYGIDGETTTTTLLTGSPQIVKVQVSVPFSSVAGLVPMPASITVVSTAMYEDVNN